MRRGEIASLVVFGILIIGLLGSLFVSKNGITGMVASSASGSMNLTIWDDTDTGMLGFADAYFYGGQSITIIANFSNTTSGVAFNDTVANLTIEFPGSGAPVDNMSFNPSYQLWVYTADIPLITGTVYFRINTTSPVLPVNLSATDNFTALQGVDYGLFGYDTNYLPTANLQNLVNFSLNNTYGRVVWNGTGYNISGANFSKNLYIAPNIVSLNSSDLDQSLNSSANITMTGVNCTAYLIYSREGFYSNPSDVAGAGTVCDATTNPKCTIISCSGTELNFTVSHFTSYATGSNANLTIFDDGDPERGSQTLNTSSNIFFFANYTNTTSGAPIISSPPDNGQCVLNSTFLNATMVYNSTSTLYEMNKTIGLPGTFDYNITCGSSLFTSLNTTDNVTVNGVQCGDTIISDTTLTAADQITSTTCTGVGLYVGASGIKVDCGGFAIVGDGGDTGDNALIIDGYDNTIVQNCVFNGFGYNYSLLSSGSVYLANANNLSIINVSVTPSTAVSAYGLSLYSVSNSSFDNFSAVAEHSSAYALRLDMSADNSFVNSSFIGKYYALYSDAASNNNNFTDTFFNGSAYALQLISNNNSFVNNNIVSSGSRVVNLGGDYNLFYGNVINGTASTYQNGVYISGAYNNLTSNNITTIGSSYYEDLGALIYISRYDTGAYGGYFKDNRLNNPNQTGLFISQPPDHLAASYNRTFINNILNGNPLYFFGPSDSSSALANLSLNATQIFIAKDNFLVENITLNNSRGVYIGGANNVTFKNSNINSTLDNMEGVYLDMTDNTTLYNVTIHTSGANSHGLYVEGSNFNIINASNISTSSSSAHGIYFNQGPDNNTVSNTYVKSAASAVYLYRSSNSGSNNDYNNFSNNYLETTGTSKVVHLQGANYNRFINNLIKGSSVNSNNGILLQKGSTSSVTSNNNLFMNNNITTTRTGFTEAYGPVLYISNANNNNFTNNRFINPNQHGAYLSAATDTVFNNNFFNATASSAYDIKILGSSSNINFTGDYFGGNGISISTAAANFKFRNTKFASALSSIFFPSFNITDGSFDTSGEMTLDDNHVFINSSALQELNVSARINMSNPPANPIVFADYNDDGSYEQCTDCSVISTSPNLIFDVSHFTAFKSSPNSNLTIFDSGDAEGGSYTITPGFMVNFTASYVNLTNNVPINNNSDNGQCQIRFNVTPNGPFTMYYNLSNDGNYTYNRSFSSTGNVGWNVTCSANNFDTLLVSDNLIVSPDTTPPAVFALIPAAGSFYNTADTIEIASNATDASGVSAVIVNITFPNGTVQQLSLSNVVGDKYNVSFTIPQLTGRYNITFIANDTNNNINSTETTYFTTSDNANPSVFALVPAGGVSKEIETAVEIGVNVTDNIAVDIVSANITYPNGTWQQLSLSNVVADKYNISFTVPALLGVYNITFFANDTAGNVNNTEITNFTAIDSVAPAVFDLLPIVGGLYNISDTLEISTNVTDAIAVDSVFANITFPNGTFSIVNLAKVGTTDKYNSSFTIPALIGTYNITFFANDTSGNINGTEITNFTAADTTPPAVFALIPAGETFNVTDVIEISVNATDAISVDKVLANITSPNGASDLRILNHFGATDKYNISYTVPSSGGRYNITFIANDTSGNVNGSEQTFFIANDNLPPSSVTSLNNQSATNDSIYWTWTNPLDKDFNATIIYINGTNIINLSTPISAYNVTGLQSDSSYVITIHTRDHTGNINYTDVNSTARTLVSPDLSPPTINLVSPNNDASIANSTVTLTCNATDNMGLSNITLYHDIGQAFGPNITNLVSGTFNETNFTLTNVPDGSYFWNCNATDTSGNSALASLNYGLVIDTTPPSWSNPLTSPSSPATYNPVGSYQFNMTWAPTPDTVLIEHNFTGTLQNYSTSGNAGSVYFYNYGPIAAGSYVWREYANDSVGNLNVSDPQSYVVNKATPTINLTFNGTSANVTVETGSTVNVTGLVVTGENNFLRLYKDGIEINNGSNNVTNITTYSTPALINFTLTANETQNYTSARLTYFLNVTDTTPPSLFNIIPSAGSEFNVSDDVEISVNATDVVVVDTVMANITLPNGTTTQLTLTNVPSTEKYNSTFTVPAVAGRYNITFIANDTSGNINGSEQTYFNVTITGVGPVLSIIKTDSPDPVDNGSIINYKIKIENTGDSKAINVTLTEEYPGSVAFISSTPKANVSNTTWYLGNITNGTLATINISVRVASNATNGQILTNHINVTYENSTTTILKTASTTTTVNVPSSPAPSTSTGGGHSGSTLSPCSWNCGDWSECANNKQTRICTGDSGSYLCNKLNKTEERSCTPKAKPKKIVKPPVKEEPTPAPPSPLKPTPEIPAPISITKQQFNYLNLLWLLIILPAALLLSKKYTVVDMAMARHLLITGQLKRRGKILAPKLAVDAYTPLFKEAKKLATIKPTKRLLNAASEIQKVWDVPDDFALLLAYTNNKVTLRKKVLISTYQPSEALKAAFSHIEFRKE